MRLPPLSTRFIERLPMIPERPLIGFGITLCLCLAALGLRWELEGAFPPGYPFVSFFPAVTLSSFLFGVRSGILAGLICGLCAWFFIIPPRFAFAFDNHTLVAMAFYAGVVTIDIALVHLMQRANVRLRAAREKVRLLAEERGQLADRSDVLFQELQHRVGNNLQMIAAVLSLQLRGLEEPIARRAITNAAERLHVIGRIQRRLYRSDGALVPFDTFIAELTSQVMESSGREGIAMVIVAEPKLILHPEASVPVAMILNEAIANALQHGLGQRARGTIRVGLQRTGERIALSVEDDGAGLPLGFRPDRGDSVGLSISRALARQIGAEYALGPVMPESPQPLAQGARMTLTLPPCRTAAPS
ncbi:histidine kinase dimerization/phosphoacceptor domain -containing protein [Novosphingobium sp. BL-8H]|uniref:sensor histidine kinase n=1 Tax=Novosphingobium sp. BL-8H TaxID=3127640 RepID=UPI003757D388